MLISKPTGFDGRKRQRELPELHTRGCLPLQDMSGGRKSRKPEPNNGYCATNDDSLNFWDCPRSG